MLSLGLALVAAICSSPHCWAVPKLPQRQGFVSDFAGKLSPSAKQSLEERLRDFKDRTDGIELAVVTIPYDSLGKVSIEKYSLELARSWGIGGGKRKDGLLLLVAIQPQDERGIYHGSTRLEVSRSLEAEIPQDIAAGLIGSMHEDFIAGRFDQAVMTGVQAILRTLGQKRGFPPVSSAPSPAGPSSRETALAAPGLVTSILDGIAAFFAGGAAIGFFVVMLVVLLMVSGLRGRQSGSPGGVLYQRNLPIWRDSQQSATGMLDESRGVDSVPDAAQNSLDMSGSAGSSDPGGFSGGSDFGSASGGSTDFGSSSSGGGDFGGGGATNNW